MPAFDGFQPTFPLRVLCNQVPGDDGNPALDFITIEADDGRRVLPFFTSDPSLHLFVAMRRLGHTKVWGIPHQRSLLFVLNKCKSQGFDLVIFDPLGSKSRQGTTDELIRLVQETIDTDLSEQQGPHASAN